MYQKIKVDEDGVKKVPFSTEEGGSRDTQVNKRGYVALTINRQYTLLHSQSINYKRFST